MAVIGLVAACAGQGADDAAADDPGTDTTAAASEVDLPLAITGEVVATVDERFQSYNIEMVEVTGGEFWKPYDAGPGKVVRPPIDLSSERLRNLARALGPAYIRVSGSWANATYFDADGSSAGTVPEGFDGVLTGDQWSGVGEFARAVDGEVVTSFASSEGTRDSDGTWRGDQARALLQYSIDHDVPLVAAELFNEPGLPVGVPTGYDAATYGRDVATFTEVVDEVMPELRIVGPGATADVLPLLISPAIPAEELMEASASTLDVFSYHYYPKVSERCGSTEGPEVALTADFLSRVDASRDFYQDLRDKYVPEAPMWITETAQAACGGDRWAAQYRDIIRYVDTLGRLSAGDGDAVFHNTLASSDYGLIDEDDLVPRPDYWAAVLWARLMGPEVLAAEPADTVDDLAVYPRCTPNTDHPSVTYAVVNSSATSEHTVSAGSEDALVYLLSGDSLDADTVSLNGTVLNAADDGTLPAMEGEPAEGPITLPPATVAFVVEPTDAPACS